MTDEALEEVTVTPRERHLLRHIVATIAYRGAKSLRDAEPSFADLRVADGVRTPLEIVAHLGDLMAWARFSAAGERKGSWNPQPPKGWQEEKDRFHKLLAEFDQQITSGEQLYAKPERLIQGPLSDALTHVGQLAMLRRLAGEPIVGESYVAAEVEVGRLGPDQAPARRPFGG